MRTAAEAGVPIAQYLLGTALLMCRERCPDAKTGMDWPERGVAGGDISATVALAAALDEGNEFVEKDQARATALYLSAAERGYPSAQLAMAIKLCTGKGVAKDRAAGRNWIDVHYKTHAPCMYEDFGCK